MEIKSLNTVTPHTHMLTFGKRSLVRPPNISFELSLASSSSHCSVVLSTENVSSEHVVDNGSCIAVLNGAVMVKVVVGGGLRGRGLGDGLVGLSLVVEDVPGHDQEAEGSSQLKETTAKQGVLKTSEFPVVVFRCVFL